MRSRASYQVTSSACEKLSFFIPVVGQVAFILPIYDYYGVLKLQNLREF